MENIVNTLVDWLKGVPPIVVVAFLSMLPLLELRGGVLAAAILGIDWKIALPVCMLANAVPVPFIVLFMDKILALLKKTRLKKLVTFLENKAAKGSESVNRYKRFGLYLFVAVPLPTTGAWTGSLIASLFRINVKDSFISIFLGIITAGLIMALVSYGGLAVIASLFS